MAWHGMGQRARRRSELAWQCPAETRDDGAHGRTLVLVSERDGETIAAGSGRSAAGFDALIFLVLGFGAERGREAGVSSLGPCRWSRLSDFQTCSENSVVPMAWVWRTNPTNPSPFTHLARALDMVVPTCYPLSLPQPEHRPGAERFESSKTRLCSQRAFPLCSPSRGGASPRSL